MTPPRLHSIDGGADDWRSTLIYGRPNKEGESFPIRHHANVSLVLRNCPTWRGAIRYNTWSSRIEIHRAIPWREEVTRPIPWLDEDTTRLQQWIVSEVSTSIGTGVDDTERGIRIVADENAYDPVADWFGSLKWDGKHRLDSWLINYLGAPSNTYVKMVGRWWMISAVARALRPGCKADHVLILQGLTGIGKSTALSILARDESSKDQDLGFTDTPIVIGNKDSYQAIQGCLIIELAELESIRRAPDVSAAKAFFTSRTDRFRPPFGRRMVDVARRCVFAGSVELDEFLVDEKNRRYWPVKCFSLDKEGLEANRVQLWAEAVAAYRAGEKWNPQTREERKMCAEEVAERRTADAWEHVIEDWIASRADEPTEPAGDITISMVIERALKISDRGRWGRVEQMRVGACLRQLGYERVQARTDEGRRWVYRLPSREPGEEG